MTFKKLLIQIIIISLFIANPVFSQQKKQVKQNTESINEQEMKIAEDEEPARQTENTGPEKKLGTFTFWDFLRMILILAFVILCIYGFFYILKKAGNQKFEENDFINIISSKAVSPNKSIHIVEIGNQVIVIGSSDNGISMLTEITDKETVDRIRLYKGEIKKPAENSFYKYLMDTLMKGKSRIKSSNAGNSGSFTSEFLKKQKERIGKM